MDKDELPKEREITDKPPGEDNGLSLATKVYVCILVLASLSIIFFYMIPNIKWFGPKCDGTSGYCGMAEYDAKNVMAALASYFSEPDTKRIPSINTLKLAADLSLINDNPEPNIWPPAGTNAYHNNTIKVTVYDNSGCCPRGSAYIATSNVFMAVQHSYPFLGGGYWEK